MRILSVDELSKLKPATNDISFEDLPPFFCIVCQEEKKGSFISGVEIGGYCCAWHKTEEINNSSLLKKGVK